MCYIKIKNNGSKMSRLIKRYENRKLYDTEARKYVSLEELAILIRNGTDVQIVDNSSNKDITTQTLTQVIFEEGKKGRNPLSKEVLHDVIRWGNTVIDDSIKQVRHSLDSLVPHTLQRLFGAANNNEIEELKKKVESLENVINKLNVDQKTKTSQKSKKR
jgi:polyhydroxyalkanoate synthesis repressor PhaR